jgi:hypothetical protein
MDAHLGLWRWAELIGLRPELVNNLEGLLLDVLHRPHLLVLLPTLIIILLLHRLW